MKILLCNDDGYQATGIVALYEALRQIADVVIDRPIMIAGLPRSGTTHLVNLLAADPRLRPRGEMLVLPRAAHLHHLEQPDLFLAAVRAFLRRADAFS